MSARRALVPPELRELLDLLGELAEPLPDAKAGSADGWTRRRDLEDSRSVLLRVKVSSLADQLRICDKYPGVAAETLASHCRIAAEAVREHLAKPLGYEPEAGR